MLPEEDFALEFATARHGEQKYGLLPYSVHLLAVNSVACFYWLDTDIRVASFLHDLFEDTRTTHFEVSSHFGVPIADLVEAVTGRGKTRPERNRDAYTKIILMGIRAARLKLCDRLANAKASRIRAVNARPGFIQDDYRLFEMYQRELPGFLDMIEKSFSSTPMNETDVRMVLNLKMILSPIEKEEV